MPSITEDKNRAEWWPWAICVVLLLATLLNYMDRQALAVTLPTLKQKFHLAEGRVGLIEGCFGYAFAFGSLFFGWLADRMGPRLLYPAVLAGWSLAGMATSLAGNDQLTGLLEHTGDEPGTGVFRWLLLCRIVLGVCEAGHWPCALLTVRAILTSQHRTLGNGILQSGASIGAVLVPLYIEAAERAGKSWEFPFWSIGLAGLCWIPLWFALIRGRDLSRPRDGAVGSTIRSGTLDTSHSDQASTFSNSSDASATEGIGSRVQASSEDGLLRRLLVLAIVVSTLTISWQFLRAWLALFLQDHHGYSRQATRGLMSGYFIASDVGCILSGLVVSWLSRRHWSVHHSRLAGFLLFCLLTAAGALVPYAGNGWLMVALLFVAGAGILGLHPFYYSLIQELSSRHMGTFSGALAAVGWVITGSFQGHLGAYIQENKSYDLGLLIVGLAPVLGLAALVLLWPGKAGRKGG
ncbi:MAG: MFS transporter [Planctomycetaceae bacterium]|nr:MFS transporter [Planctomycetaceae bacterium]